MLVINDNNVLICHFRKDYFFILITEIDIRKLFLYEEMLKTLQPKL